MVNMLNARQAAGRRENIIGWYHSHPGFGLFLSGTDVATQHGTQQYDGKWLVPDS